MREQVVTGHGAVEADLGLGPLADVLPRGEVRHRHRHDEDRRQHRASRERANRRRGSRRALADERRHGNGRQERGEEDAVVPRRQALEREKEAGQQAVAHEPALQHPVERPQAERHPLRHLQLEMGVMHVAKRKKREDEAGEQRRTRAAGQRAHE